MDGTDLEASELGSGFCLLIVGYCGLKGGGRSGDFEMLGTP